MEPRPGSLEPEAGCGKSHITATSPFQSLPVSYSPRYRMGWNFGRGRALRSSTQAGKAWRPGQANTFGK